MKWITGTIALWAVAVMAAATVPVAAQIGGRPTRPQVIPPQGPVRQVIFKNCTSCHGIDDYAFNALDRAGWSALIDAQAQGSEGHASPAPDRELLLDWLVTQVRPGHEAVPAHLRRAGSHDLLQRRRGGGPAEARVHVVPRLDRVNDARFSPDRWRVVTVDMRERGAKLDRRGAGTPGRVAGQNQGDEPEPMKPRDSSCAIARGARDRPLPASRRRPTRRSSLRRPPTSPNPAARSKIRILRWSTPEQAAPLVAALNPPPPRRRVAPDLTAAGRRGAAGAGGGARAVAAARGRGRGAAPAAPLSPTAALTQAIGRAPTIGYIWTNDVTGYSIKYAYRAAAAGWRRAHHPRDRSPPWRAHRRRGSRRRPSR